jgi:hypothetical protein
MKTMRKKYVSPGVEIHRVILERIIANSGTPSVSNLEYEDYIEEPEVEQVFQLL